MGKFNIDAEGPLSRGQYENLKFDALALMKKYPVDELEFDPKNLDFDTWLAETLKTAEKSVYTDIDGMEGLELSDEYIEARSKMLEQQLVLSGLRLANLLEELYHQGAFDEYKPDSEKHNNYNPE